MFMEPKRIDILVHGFIEEFSYVLCTVGRQRYRKERQGKGMGGGGGGRTDVHQGF
jgi:hypothetical protein